MTTFRTRPRLPADPTVNFFFFIFSYIFSGTILHIYMYILYTLYVYDDRGLCVVSCAASVSCSTPWRSCFLVIRQRCPTKSNVYVYIYTRRYIFASLFFSSASNTHCFPYCFRPWISIDRREKIRSYGKRVAHWREGPMGLETLNIFKLFV